MHCVLCGNSAVGKSTLLEQLVRRQPGLAEPTIGVAFMRYCTPAGQLEIWDTAGQEQYQPMLPLYFRRASAVVVVFDLTCPGSIAAVPQWVTHARNHAPDGVCIVLVGTKCDLRPAVPESEARHLVERLGLGGYWETSGMTGQGVEAPFDYLLKHARPLDENRAGMELVGVHDKPAWRSNCCQS